MNNENAKRKMKKQLINNSLRLTRLLKKRRRRVNERPKGLMPLRSVLLCTTHCQHTKADVALPHMDRFDYWEPAEEREEQQSIGTVGEVRFVRDGVGASRGALIGFARNLAPP